MFGCAEVYAILPCQGESFPAGHRRVIREIGGHTPAVGAHPVVAAVGGRVDALTDLRRSRDEAVRTLDYLLHRHSNDRQATVTALHEDHRVTLDLLRVGDFIVDNGLADGDLVERIRAHGEQLQTDFLDTLRVYLDCNGNVAQTAQRLHVHGNTIRYRIARLTEDFGVELDDPRTRLWLWLRLACAADTSSRPSGPRR